MQITYIGEPSHVTSARVGGRVFRLLLTFADGERGEVSLNADVSTKHGRFQQILIPNYLQINFYNFSCQKFGFYVIKINLF